MKKLLVQLVTWNGEKYIPHLFASLREQTLKNTEWELLILDNASTDKTVEAIEKELQNFDITHTFTKSTENIGFAGGHNQLFRQYESEYILLLNQDLYLTKNCLDDLVSFMDRTNTAAAVAPRLMRWNFEKIASGIEATFSEFVDAMGLKVYKNRRIVEQETKQVWSEIHGNYQKDVIEVFGVSGALPLYRRQMLEKVAFEDENFFDQTYHSYKEDVDLAFRLTLAGYGSYILRDTIAYHDRSGAGPKELTDRAAMKNKKDQSSWVSYHSYKNHLATLIKNEYWQNVLLDFFAIVWYEKKKFFYYLVFDRKPLVGLKELFSNLSLYIARREQIKKLRRRSWRDMRVWWTKS